MLVITYVIAWTLVITAALAGLAAGFVVGWIAAGGRCGLGLHDWGPQVEEIIYGVPGQVERCVRCGLRRIAD